MRPLRGVVTRVNQTSVLVRLESGKLVETDNSRLQVRKYDVVEVHYDYTTNSIVDIVRRDPNREVKEGADESEMVVLEDAEDSDDALEVLMETDSGALCPMDDRCWDSEEGVLVVEGESSTEYI